VIDQIFNPDTCFIFLAVALAFLVMEAFIPSFGVLSVISLSFAGAAIYSAFNGAESLGLGIFVVSFVVIGFPLVLIVLFKNLHLLPMGNKLIPPAPEAPPRRSIEHEDLVGKRGVTVTPLMPSGAVRINSKRVDVLTSGEHIERNVPVIVERIEGNRVFVRKIEE
jgi:membrane-bound serine protease (ClpP class)